MSARKVEQNKITQDESGVSLEHHAAYDDDFLPSADELSKLKSIDPSIVPWVMKMSEQEQKARISFNHRRMDLAHKEVNLSGFMTFAGLFFATVIIIGVFYLAYLLISGGYQIAGTIFGTIDLAALILAMAKLSGRK